MSAETLREAARLMLERAAGATSGPWSVGVDPETGERSIVYSEFVASRYATSDPAVARVVARQYPGPDDDGDAEWGQTSDAEHISGWTPEVADALADLLDTIARATVGTSRGDIPFEDEALAVARAYLGAAS